MYKSYSMELAGRTLTVDINRVAKPANLQTGYLAPSRQDTA